MTCLDELSPRHMTLVEATEQVVYLYTLTASTRREIYLQALHEGDQSLKLLT